MAALTDAMKWFALGKGGQVSTVPRLKYHFQVIFYTGSYQQELGFESRLLLQKVKSVELPKFSIETEIVNAWNIRQPIGTRVNFEPVSITLHDTQDNAFQNFIKKYMNIVSGNFAETKGGIRTGFDTFGLQMLETKKDSPIDKIEIIRFYGADENRTTLQNTSMVTLWRPRIVDVQHDTLDYSASEGVQWQISLRYDSITYKSENEAQVQTSTQADQFAKPQADQFDKIPQYNYTNPNIRDFTA